MPDLIDKISENLTQRFPHVDYTIKTKNQLIIEGTNSKGFEIFIEQTETENTIYFNNWHFHFENTQDQKNELIEYLVLGMSKQGRLKAFLRNGKEYKWTFEILSENDGTWHAAGTTGLINLKFWQQTEIKYYQNHWIDLDELNKTVGIHPKY